LVLTELEVSVQAIYGRLNSDFYDVLQEVHGEASDKRPWGHRLFQMFPILRTDPPHEFVERCIDHFIHIVQVEQMIHEIEYLKDLTSRSADEGDLALEKLLALIRDVQLQQEIIHNRDTALAEEAMDIRRLWAPAQWVMAA
jgi:hypothetical protein